MQFSLFVRFLIIFFLTVHFAYGQERTVGVITITDDVAEGYTLISPISFNKTYLINNCGEVINEWTSDYTAGLMAYLLEDGRLLRAGRSDAEFGAGGGGGIIELFSWEGDLLWSYEYSDNRVQHHHDVEYLPNGNILMIAWVQLTEGEILDTGRELAFVQSNRGLWTERVLEIKPIGLNDADIIWEWNVYDHLIQDTDSMGNNYGVVEDHPELLDANYPYRSLNSGDWMHFNSIDYNEELDQIILSSRNFSELFIIDHSTTTEEASSHTGGRYGKGGDILYRWGNPQTYKRGTADDIVFYGQHDPHFVEIDNDDNDKIMIFNNGVGRNPFFSSLDIIETDHIDGFYSIDSILPYGPDRPSESIKSTTEINFDSPRISGGQQLPNGNILICSGNNYELVEITPDGELAWLYENPVGSFGPQPQGSIGGSRDIFRAFKYDIDYPAFDNRDLIPGELLELDPIDDACGILISSHNEIDSDYDIVVFPNPTSEVINVTSVVENLDYKILNIAGRLIDQGELEKNKINVSSLDSGIYILQLHNNNHQFITKFAKQ